MQRLRQQTSSRSSTSDMLAGSVLDIAPLEGDDFQSLLPLLPGVVRGPDGRLRAKGGQPTQGALQISSTSLVDPSSGDFDLELPGQSLESVELLANPFAAEYGRFSTSVTQIRTRRGTNEWEVKPGNLVPRFRKGFCGVRGFEPRFSVRGPLKKDRVFLAQDVQFRYVADPVKSLPGEPDIRLTSFDSFTPDRRRAVAPSYARRAHRHVPARDRAPHDEHLPSAGGHARVQPERRRRSACRIGSRCRRAWCSRARSRAAGSRSTSTPTAGSRWSTRRETQRGSFFNDQEREVTSVQWVETLSLSRSTSGTGSTCSSSASTSRTRATTARARAGRSRSVGSTARWPSARSPARRRRRTSRAAELALFAQDRWRIGSRVTLELGLRMDREDVIERVNWSPRGGVSIGVLPEGRAHSPRRRRQVPAADAAQRRRVRASSSRAPSRDSAPTAQPLGPPVTLVNVPAPDLRTPEAVAGNIEWNQRFGRRVLFKANYLKRSGSHEYILEPDPSTRRDPAARAPGRHATGSSSSRAAISAASAATSRVSYVRSHGVADLNNYDQFYGNLRNPIVRPNEHNLIPTDVPHRLLVRGTIGLPGKWDFAPVIEIRSGFPWSAVDEFQDFVGPRNRAGRLPQVRAFDFSLSRPWHVWKYRFRAGIKVYNVFGASAERDVQNNIASPEFGQFFNPIERSIGFVLNTR